MNIEHLRLFVRLASTHNISQAGQELGLSAAVASAHINKLEQGLAVRLLHRTTRKVSLTEEGLAFLPHAENVLASVDEAYSAVGAGDASPSGTLRVAAPSSFGRLHLVPALGEFMARYPKLKLDFRLSDTMIDMVEGGFDIAVRNAELKDSTLIARKLAKDIRIICASPNYLKEFGTPQTPEDLVQHQCINLIGMEQWHFDTPTNTSSSGVIGKQTIKTHGNFRTDSGEAMRDACINGLGLTINARWNVHKQLQSGELVQVLAEYPLLSDTAIWAVYPSSRLLAPKVRAFIDFFAEQFEQAEWI